MFDGELLVEDWDERFGVMHRVEFVGPVVQEIGEGLQVRDGGRGF